uniref:Xylulose kinase-1 n=1 Tax=Tanacetum cinerariifolium TaxID=118510 RepID=A0A6L2NHK3_TANCI|nr:xylulose kinase-1 [Tanacetum cinerariifolium]
MIAYLTKSDASEGFGQIIDFLNASLIKYALTVNPNIYVSCIKQFWSSVSVKKVNDVICLQALIDRKKVIITEATIQEALRLDDAESIDCYPMRRSLQSYQGWDTRSLQQSSYFTSLVRNVYSSTKFYLYPRFLQLMIRPQVGDLSSHAIKYSSLTLTQKVFANMRRVGKGFSRVETPLFEGMVVAQQADDVADEGAAEIPSTSHVLPTPPPSPIAESSSPPQQQQPSQPTHDAKILMDLLHTLLETCTTLTRKVKALEQDKVAQALEIIKLKQMVKKVERKNKLKVSGLKRLRKREIIANIDTDKDVTLKDVAAFEKDAEIEENVLSIQDDELETAKLKEVVEVVTTGKLMTEVVKAASATITAATTPITTATPLLLLRRLKNRWKRGKQTLKRKTKSFKEKAVKKQKLDKDVEELKKHLQIVPSNDDDVYTEATPLALKVPVVDYEIHIENNKPYFKIIRADGTHQLFLSFLSLLRNFDREDLEVLWQIVKERLASSIPKNFSDDFLLTTLTYMFEKPNVEAQVWKSQRGVYGLPKVKSWRLLESCRVHVITLTTTQMILLVERRYLLTRFTLDRMLNNV